MSDCLELMDYEEAEIVETPFAKNPKKNIDGTYVSIHSIGFCDFVLKPELLRAIADCGFEHPSEVQHECITQAVLGSDIICQAQSGMGKTAIFVLSTLQQLKPKKRGPHVLVICPSRELAFQISKEYERFAKYLPKLRIAVYIGGLIIEADEKSLKYTLPHIIIGTPGRIAALVRNKTLNLKRIKHFILDECDLMLERNAMRTDIQKIYRSTPHNKQVMMFSATLSKETRAVCKEFMQDPIEIYVDDESKLTLHRLQQHYVDVKDTEKSSKLFELLDMLEFNQVVIFVNSIQSCVVLTTLLVEQNFSAVYIHCCMPQEERLQCFQEFRNFQKRILVTTNLFFRGMDIERLNIVFNYDMPENTDAYLHSVARASRFGTKGLAISFVSGEEDKQILTEVESRFDVKITELPEQIELSKYIEER